MKKAILPIFFVTILILSSSYTTLIHAQSPPVSTAPTSTQTITPTPTIVKSDFAIDLEEGEKDTANDQEAIENQKDQKENEDVDVNEQGEVENEVDEVDEQDMEQSSDDLEDGEENESNEGIDELRETTGEKDSDESDKDIKSITPRPSSAAGSGHREESDD